MIRSNDAILAALAIAVALLATSAAAQMTTTPPKGGGKAAQRGCVAGEPSFLRDEALAVKVAAQLQFNKTLLRERVDVKVSGGVVTLWGNMTTREHIALAVKLASQIQGVRCVNNLLKVGPPEYDESGTPRNL